MFCCCSSKNSSLFGALAAAGVMLGATYAASVLFPSGDAVAETEVTDAALLSEAVYGAWDGKATGEDLPPEGEAFVLLLAAGEGGAITGSLTTTNFGGFDVKDASFDASEKVFACTIVNQDDPNMAAGFVAVVEGDSMVGVVTTPETEYELTAARRKN